MRKFQQKLHFLEPAVQDTWPSTLDSSKCYFFGIHSSRSVHGVVASFVQVSFVGFKGFSVFDREECIYFEEWFDVSFFAVFSSAVIYVLVEFVWGYSVTTF